MKKKISILTATRAEYGLLRPVIKKLSSIEEFEINVVVTGAHLSPEFGMTYKEIENDNIKIHEKIEILLSADTSSSISKSMGLAMISFADYFEKVKPDLLLVLGDRYETLAVCTAAMNARIPIAHLYGGETTEGAIDESIRHAITKMSYLHFTSTQKYRKRVIQLGESPNRVFTVGAMGIENALKEKFMSKNDLEESIDFKLDKPYSVVTFHPVTLESSSSENQINDLLKVCEKHDEIKYIFTKANADADGRIINNAIDKYVKENKNAIAFSSMGVVRYLSSLKYCDFVMGNSSSGLIEAPSFGVPIINIGDRQKGRLQADSVINCKANYFEIDEAIKKVETVEFKEKSKYVVNPYGDGNTSEKIIKKIEEFLLEEKIELKKKFYDCEMIK